MKILYKITDYRYVDYDNDIEFIRDTRILFGGEIRCWWEYKKNGKMNEYIEITDGIDFNSSNKQEKLDELDKQFFDFIRKIGYDIFKEDGSNAKIPDGKYEWEYDVDKAEMVLRDSDHKFTFTNCYPVEN